MERFGFVWSPPGQTPPVQYEPGIPSLMNYVLKHHVPPPTGGNVGGEPPVSSREGDR